MDLAASLLPATSKRKKKAPYLRYGACENYLFVKEGLIKYISDEEIDKEKKRLRKGRNFTGLGCPDAKSRRRTDIKQMTSAAGRGGRAEVNNYSGPSPLSDCLPHRPHPSDCAYDEMVFYADVFSDYYRIKSERQAEALATDSEAVKKKDRSIIKKVGVS